ncbi:hypothetical protein LVJ94_12580 [Pendulispora rubella]|uniref:Uncharacterized protein n=1 Tax=Pendulispora rubella TaxID=2741070 RepID=A0ABZ2LCG2_9BACT
MANGTTTLYERVLASSGLSRIFVDGVLRRACARANVNVDTMTPDGLRKALPYIEDSLRIYLAPTEVERRVGAIRKLAE